MPLGRDAYTNEYVADPVVLGDGTKRLLKTVPKRTFALVGSIAFPTGVVVHTCHPTP